MAAIVRVEFCLVVQGDQCADHFSNKADPLLSNSNRIAVSQEGSF